MKIEFDPAKNAKNILERGINFKLAAEFDLATAIVGLIRAKIMAKNALLH
jgi:uncharacterized DUF497 family protein